MHEPAQWYAHPCSKTGGSEGQAALVWQQWLVNCWPVRCCLNAGAKPSVCSGTPRQLHGRPEALALLPATVIAALQLVASYYEAPKARSAQLSKRVLLRMPPCGSAGGDSPDVRIALN